MGAEFLGFRFSGNRLLGIFLLFITISSQILADPESQEKVFTFQGIRGFSWVRIKEVVAFDAVPLIFTPAEKEPAQTAQTK